MNFRRLALSNVKGSWHRYLSFYLSSALSVGVFYLFAAFLNHPGLTEGYIRGGENTRTMLVVSEYLIMIFSFLFVLYSSSAFLTARKKEFGLLSLLGMTKGQLRRLVVLEDMLVAGASIVTGIGIGILFSKLFFMAMAQFLHVANPLPFMIVGRALWITVGGFAAVFGVISVLSALRVGRSKVVTLLTAARKPKRPPVYSRLLSLLALLLLGGGYYYAATARMQTVANRMFPVTIVVTIGTYFLFTQFSVAALRWLKRRKPLYYHNTTMLTVSQLVFRLRDNARLMFVVATLTAVVLTATGSLYAIYDEMAQSVRIANPQAVGWIETGINRHPILDPARVDKLLQEAGVDVDYRVSIVAVPARVTLAGGPTNARSLLISEDDYNRVVKAKGYAQELAIEPGHIAYARLLDIGGTAETFAEGKQATLGIGEETVQVSLAPQTPRVTVNPPQLGWQMFIVDDAQYEEWRAGVPDSELVVIHGYEFENWLEYAPKIAALVPAEQSAAFSSRVPAYIDLKQRYALTVFVGVFVAVLFFVASGSLLYFKLFTELHEDRAHFEALRRIGISRHETGQVLGTQIGLMFFVPFAVGMVHSAFAFKALGNVIRSSTVGYMLLAVMLFLSLQVAYFFLARRLYMNQVTAVRHGI